MSFFYNNNIRKFRSKYFTVHPHFRNENMNKSTKTSTSEATGTNVRRSPKKPEVLRVLPEPFKSEMDRKKYKVVQLQNGLVACLIADEPSLAEDEEMCETECSEKKAERSEKGAERSKEGSGTKDSEDEDVPMEDAEDRRLKRPEEKLAAAALCVGVGSFSDPKDVPGLAHLLEHMVFMGSEKYPKENAFDEFIQLHGGIGNANTHVETTVFRFECLDKHFEEALDRFSQFFVSPLMKKEAMTRERESIESEFQWVAPLDFLREHHLLRSLAKKESPVNNFSWGNLLTLRDNVDDDELYEQLHEFRKRHYSAHRITLAVQAPISLKQLEQYVVSMFSDVPSNQLPANSYSENDVFNTPAFNKLYHVVPVEDVWQVDITWALPSLLHKYKSKSQHFLSHLLGAEGKGSLLSYLNKQLWVLSVTSGCGAESSSCHNSLYTLFDIRLHLTAEGYKQLNRVIEAVFSYISMLRRLGPQQTIFDELQAIMSASFNFTLAEDVVKIVESMQYCSPEDYIAGSELYYEFDPDTIRMILEQMRPEKANYMIVKRLGAEEIANCQTEKWFGTKYFVEDIPEDWLKQWQNPPVIPELCIPPVNSFITTDFSILPDVDDNPEYPTKILESPLVELWYRRDMKFKLPKAYYYFYLITPLSLRSVKNSRILFALLNYLFTEEEIYQAIAANLSCKLYQCEKGVTIEVCGLNQKLPILIKLVAEFLKNLPAMTTEDVFEALKARLQKHCYNTLLWPERIASEILSNLLIDKHWDPLDRAKAIAEITFEEMKANIEEFLKTLYVKVLVQGNVDSDTAIKTVKEFMEILDYAELKKEDAPSLKVVKVNKGETCLRLKCLEPINRISVIANYYQLDRYDIETSVMLDIILMVIEEPLFDVLRTKEQIGYHIRCIREETVGFLGLMIEVRANATKTTTQFVNERIDAFLQHTKSLLADLDSEAFDKIKSNLIKTKRCSDVHLQDEVDRNWSEIVSKSYIFDRIKITRKEIETIEGTGLKKVRKWWEARNPFGCKSNFRKLSVQIEACDGTDDERPKNIFEMKLQFIETKLQFLDAKLQFIIDEIEDFVRKDKDYFITDTDVYEKKS